MGLALSPKTSAFKLQTPGKFPEEYKLQIQKRFSKLQKEGLLIPSMGLILAKVDKDTNTC
jgi:hypothetical protein